MKAMVKIMAIMIIMIWNEEWKINNESEMKMK